MNKMLVLVLVLFSNAPQLATADDSGKLPNNAELTRIFEMDQADRKPGADGIDWDVVGPRDEARRIRALEILRSGTVRTSEDFRHAAYVFQHGETVADYRLALSLAWVAATIDPNSENAKWLTAAAWDQDPRSYGRNSRMRSEMVVGSLNSAGETSLRDSYQAWAVSRNMNNSET